MSLSGKISTAVMIASLFVTSRTQAQGCSDAGFCTMNSFTPGAAHNEMTGTKSYFKIGLTNGGADRSIGIFAGYLEYGRQVSSKLSVNAKVTALSQSGNGVSAAGISDLYVNADYKARHNITFTLGAKIPFTDGNKKKNNVTLPMDYQASLGTFDFIAGVSTNIKKLQLAAAVQQPLTQNKNQFFAGNYPATSALSKFQSTNKFKRSGDALLRASYPFVLSKKLSFTPGLLSIYHFANDRFTDITGKENDIAGSKGLTLNGTVYLDYQLPKHQSIQLNFGSPFVIRDTRPDGLTRSYVLTLEYKIRF
jgi:hypothetical protein